MEKLDLAGKGAIQCFYTFIEYCKNMGEQRVETFAKELYQSFRKVWQMQSGFLFTLFKCNL